MPHTSPGEIIVCPYKRLTPTRPVQILIYSWSAIVYSWNTGTLRLIQILEIQVVVDEELNAFTFSTLQISQRYNLAYCIRLLMVCGSSFWFVLSRPFRFRNQNCSCFFYNSSLHVQNEIANRVYMLNLYHHLALFMCDSSSSWHQETYRTAKDKMKHQDLISKNKSSQFWVTFKISRKKSVKRKIR